MLEIPDPLMTYVLKYSNYIFNKKHFLVLIFNVYLHLTIFYLMLISKQNLQQLLKYSDAITFTLTSEK